MSRLTRNSEIKVLDKVYSVDDLVNTLIYLPIEEVKEFFGVQNLLIPRKLKMGVLRAVLYDSVQQTIEERKTLADELGYRLTWFEKFTELQLENLLVYYKDSDLNSLYFETLWVELLNYCVDMHVPHDKLKQLIDSSIIHASKEDAQLPDVKNFNWESRTMFFDVTGELDGLTPEQIRPVLYKSSTLVEIRELGKKYEINVPNRLKKQELLDIIIEELKDRNTYSIEEEKKLKGMNIIVMQRYAINNKIKASTELKKEELIEYVLKNAKQTRETYYVPGQDVYDVEKEAVVVEQEQIVPVRRADGQIVQYVQDNTELVEELRLIREAILQNRMATQDIEVALRQLQSQTPVSEELVETESIELEIDPLVVEGSEFYGNKKEWKRLYNEIKDSEVLVETEEIETPAPLSKECGPDVELFYVDKSGAKSPHPTEAKVFGTILKMILKLVIILVLVALLILLAYGSLTFFVEIQFLEPVTNALDGVVIGGHGLVTWIHKLYELFGLTKKY